jgi:hypothetical protein
MPSPLTVFGQAALLCALLCALHFHSIVVAQWKNRQQIRTFFSPIRKPNRGQTMRKKVNQVFVG